MAKATKKAPVAVPKAMKKKKSKAMKKQQVAVKFNGGLGDAKMEIVWKNHLHNAIMKSSGGTVTVKPTFTCTEDADRLYKCTCTFKGKSYKSDKPAPSKQAAEHAAAKACMEAMYPEEFKFCAKGREIGGAKKKLTAEEKPPLSAKCKLCDAIQLLVRKNLKRSLAADDMKWETDEKDKMYKCKVTISPKVDRLVGGKSFTGKVCDSKKAGEDLVAATAYTQMKSTLAPLETAALAAKKAKNKAKVELLKKKQAAKKAAAK
jgi:hypothetical protein